MDKVLRLKLSDARRDFTASITTGRYQKLSISTQISVMIPYVRSDERLAAAVGKLKMELIKQIIDAEVEYEE